MDILTLTQQDTELRKVAGTGGGEYIGACPFCGGVDRFHVWPSQGRFCCMDNRASRNGCGRSGDVIAYLVERGAMSRRDAYRERRKDDRKAPETKLRNFPLAELPGAAWCDRARATVEHCAKLLYADAGKPGREWLYGRGLTDDTIRTWKLGWRPSDLYDNPRAWGLDGGKRIWLPRGVVIPWLVDGEVQHVKVRRFDGNFPVAESAKYVRVRGGQPTLYGADFITGKQVATICEGELDAPLLWQIAGDLVDVVAIGTKGAKPDVGRLTPASIWLIALDADAGDAAGWWEANHSAARRARPLQGNDVTDFYQAGGDLRAWTEYHIERTAPETRLTLRFPGDLPGLAVPVGQWRRDPDGAIVATFADRTELAWCLVASGSERKEILEILQ